MNQQFKTGDNEIMREMMEEMYTDNAQNTFIPQADTDPPTKQDLWESTYGNAFYSAARSIGDVPDDLASYDRLGVDYNPYDVERSMDERAINQPFLEQLTRAGNRFVQSAVYQTVGSAGAILDIPDYFNSDNEIGNAITRWADERRKSMDDTVPIYIRESKDKPLGSYSWWLKNGADLAASIVSFGATGAVVGRGLSSLKWLNLVTKGTKAAQLPTATATAAQAANRVGPMSRFLTGQNIEAIANGQRFANTMLTSTALNQAESIMSASEVFGDVYSDAVNRGFTDEKAREIASSAATYTMNVNRANIMLNMTSAARFLKTPDAIKSNLRTQSNALKDFFTFKRDGKQVTNLYRDIAGESIQEALEEVINVYSETRGKKYAEGLYKDYQNTKIHHYKGLFDAGNVDKLAQTAATKEGMEAALLGALGGAGQTMIQAAINKYGRGRLLGEKVAARNDDGSIKYTKKDLTYQQDTPYKIGEAIHSDVVVDGNTVAQKGDIVTPDLIAKFGPQLAHKAGDKVLDAEGNAVQVDDQVQYEADGAYVSVDEANKIRSDQFESVKNKMQEIAERTLGVETAATQIEKQYAAIDAVDSILDPSVQNKDEQYDVLARWSLNNKENAIDFDTQEGQTALQEKIKELKQEGVASLDALKSKAKSNLIQEQVWNAASNSSIGSLISIYEDMAAMDAEAAQQANLHPNYKQQAESIINQIKKLSKLHTEYTAKYDNRRAKALYDLASQNMHSELLIEEYDAARTNLMAEEEAKAQKLSETSSTRDSLTKLQEINERQEKELEKPLKEIKEIQEKINELNSRTGEIELEKDKDTSKMSEREFINAVADKNTRINKEIIKAKSDLARKQDELNTIRQKYNQEKVKAGLVNNYNLQQLLDYNNIIDKLTQDIYSNNDEFIRIRDRQLEDISANQRISEGRRQRFIFESTMNTLMNLQKAGYTVTFNPTLKVSPIDKYVDGVMSRIPEGDVIEDAAIDKAIQEYSNLLTEQEKEELNNNLTDIRSQVNDKLEVRNDKTKENITFLQSLDRLGFLGKLEKVGEGYSFVPELENIMFIDESEVEFYRTEKIPNSDENMFIVEDTGDGLFKVTPNPNISIPLSPQDLNRVNAVPADFANVKRRVDSVVNLTKSRRARIRLYSEELKRKRDLLEEGKDQTREQLNELNTLIDNLDAETGVLASAISLYEDQYGEFNPNLTPNQLKEFERIITVLNSIEKEQGEEAYAKIIELSQYEIDKLRSRLYEYYEEIDMLSEDINMKMNTLKFLTDMSVEADVSDEVYEINSQIAQLLSEQDDILATVNDIRKESLFFSNVIDDVIDLSVDTEVLDGQSGLNQYNDMLRQHEALYDNIKEFVKELAKKRSAIISHLPQQQREVVTSISNKLRKEYKKIHSLFEGVPISNPVILTSYVDFVSKYEELLGALGEVQGIVTPANTSIIELVNDVISLGTYLTNNSYTQEQIDTELEEIADSIDKLNETVPDTTEAAQIQYDEYKKLRRRARELKSLSHEVRLADSVNTVLPAMVKIHDSMNTALEQNTDVVINFKNVIENISGSGKILLAQHLDALKKSSATISNALSFYSDYVNDVNYLDNIAEVNFILSSLGGVEAINKVSSRVNTNVTSLRGIIAKETPMILNVLDKVKSKLNGKIDKVLSEQAPNSILDSVSTLEDAQLITGEDIRTSSFQSIVDMRRKLTNTIDGYQDQRVFIDEQLKEVGIREKAIRDGLADLRVFAPEYMETSESKQVQLELGLLQQQGQGLTRAKEQHEELSLLVSSLGSLINDSLDDIDSNITREQIEQLYDESDLAAYNESNDVNDLPELPSDRVIRAIEEIAAGEQRDSLMPVIDAMFNIKNQEQAEEFVEQSKDALARYSEKIESELMPAIQTLSEIYKDLQQLSDAEEQAEALNDKEAILQSYAQQDSDQKSVDATGEVKEYPVYNAQGELIGHRVLYDDADTAMRKANFITDAGAHTRYTIGYDEDGRPVYEDEYDENGFPIFVRNTQMIEWKTALGRIQTGRITDANGNVIEPAVRYLTASNALIADQKAKSNAISSASNEELKSRGLAVNDEGEIFIKSKDRFKKFLNGYPSIEVKGLKEKIEAIQTKDDTLTIAELDLLFRYSPDYTGRETISDGTNTEKVRGEGVFVTISDGEGNPYYFNLNDNKAYTQPADNASMVISTINSPSSAEKIQFRNSLALFTAQHMGIDSVIYSYSDLVDYLNETKAPNVVVEDIPLKFLDAAGNEVTFTLKDIVGDTDSIWKAADDDTAIKQAVRNRISKDIERYRVATMNIIASDRKGEAIVDTDVEISEGFPLQVKDYRSLSQVYTKDQVKDIIVNTNKAAGKEKKSTSEWGARVSFDDENAPSPKAHTGEVVLLNSNNEYFTAKSRKVDDSEAALALDMILADFSVYLDDPKAKLKSVVNYVDENGDSVTAPSSPIIRFKKGQEITADNMPLMSRIVFFSGKKFNASDRKPWDISVDKSEEGALSKRNYLHYGNNKIAISELKNNTEEQQKFIDWAKSNLTLSVNNKLLQEKKDAEYLHPTAITYDLSSKQFTATVKKYDSYIDYLFDNNVLQTKAVSPTESESIGGMGETNVGRYVSLSNLYDTRTTKPEPKPEAKPADPNAGKPKEGKDKVKTSIVDSDFLSMPDGTPVEFTIDFDMPLPSGDVITIRTTIVGKKSTVEVDIEGNKTSMVTIEPDLKQSKAINLSSGQDVSKNLQVLIEGLKMPLTKTREQLTEEELSNPRFMSTIFNSIPLIFANAIAVNQQSGKDNPFSIRDVFKTEFAKDHATKPRLYEEPNVDETITYASTKKISDESGLEYKTASNETLNEFTPFNLANQSESDDLIILKEYKDKDGKIVKIDVKEIAGAHKTFSFEVSKDITEIPNTSVYKGSEFSGIKDIPALVEYIQVAKTKIDLLDNISPSWSNIPIQFNPDYNGYMKYTRGEIIMGSRLQELSKAKQADVLLHELIHHFTTSNISKFIKDPSKASARVKDAFDDLTFVRGKVINTLLDSKVKDEKGNTNRIWINLLGYAVDNDATASKVQNVLDNLKEEVKQGKITSVTFDMFIEKLATELNNDKLVDKMKMDVYEFVAAVFEDKDFITTLNDIELEAGETPQGFKTLFQKVLGVIRDILGIDIKNNSALKKAIDASLIFTKDDSFIPAEPKEKEVKKINPPIPQEGSDVPNKLPKVKEPAPATSRDTAVEAKKAEIERINEERKEELESTDLYEYDIKFKEFQTYGNTVKEAFDNLFEQVKNNPTSKELSDLLDYINDRLVPEDIRQDSNKNPLVQEYIDDNQKNIDKANKSTKSRQSKINAKYDAEIAALEQQETNVDTEAIEQIESDRKAKLEAEIKILNEKKKEELKEKAPYVLIKGYFEGDNNTIATLTFRSNIDDTYAFTQQHHSISNYDLIDDSRLSKITKEQYEAAIKAREIVEEINAEYDARIAALEQSVTEPDTKTDTEPDLDIPDNPDASPDVGDIFRYPVSDAESENPIVSRLQDNLQSTLDLLDNIDNYDNIKSLITNLGYENDYIEMAVGLKNQVSQEEAQNIIRDIVSTYVEARMVGDSAEFDTVDGLLKNLKKDIDNLIRYQDSTDKIVQTNFSSIFPQTQLMTDLTQATTFKVKDLELTLNEKIELYDGLSYYLFNAIINKGHVISDGINETTKLELYTSALSSSIETMRNYIANADDSDSKDRMISIADELSSVISSDDINTIIDDHFNSVLTSYGFGVTSDSVLAEEVDDVLSAMPDYVPSYEIDPKVKTPPLAKMLLAAVPMKTVTFNPIDNSTRQRYEQIRTFLDNVKSKLLKDNTVLSDKERANLASLGKSFKVSDATRMKIGADATKPITDFQRTLANDIINKGLPIVQNILTSGGVSKTALRNNNFGLPTLDNFGRVWNYIARRTSNIPAEYDDLTFAVNQIVQQESSKPVNRGIHGINDFASHMAKFSDKFKAENLSFMNSVLQSLAKYEMLHNIVIVEGNGNMYEVVANTDRKLRNIKSNWSRGIIRKVSDTNKVLGKKGSVIPKMYVTKLQNMLNNAKTEEQVITVLAELGINFNDPNRALVSLKQRTNESPKQFTQALISYMDGVIGKPAEQLFDSAQDAVSGRIATLVESELENDTDIVTNQFMSFDGNIVYALQQYHSLSYMTTELNKYSGTNKSLLLSNLPYYGDPYVSNSKLIDYVIGGGKLGVGAVNGSRFSRSDDAGTETSKFGFPEHISMRILSVLNGNYHIPQAADRKVFNTLKLDTKSLLYNSENEVLNAFTGYLLDEVSIATRYNGDENYRALYHSKDGNKLRIFDAILSLETKELLDAEFIKPGNISNLPTNPTDLARYDKTHNTSIMPAVYADIKNFFDGYIDDLKRKEMKDNGITERTPTFAYGKDLRDVLVIDEESNKSIPVFQGMSRELYLKYSQDGTITAEETLDNILYDYVTNQMGFYIEFTKLYSGDPLHYMSEDTYFKRMSMINSTRKASITGETTDYNLKSSRGIRVMNNENKVVLLNRTQSMEFINNPENFFVSNYGIPYNNSAVIGSGFRLDGKKANSRFNNLTFNDVEVMSEFANDSVNKVEIEGVEIIYYDADNNKLEGEQVSLYRKIFTESVVNSGVRDSKLIGIKVAAKLSAYQNINEADGSGMITLDEYRELLQRNGDWTPSHERAYLKALTGQDLTYAELSYFNPLKTQYTGPMDMSNTSNENAFVPMGFKHVVVPLIPQMIKGTNLEKLNNWMTANQVGVAQFASANKFGTLRDKKGNINSFYGEDGSVSPDNWNTKLVQSAYYKFFAVQVDNAPKLKGNVTSGSQKRKNILADIFPFGKAADAKLNDAATEYVNLQNEITSSKLDRLKRELGFTRVKNRVMLKNIDVLKDMLLDSARSRSATDNVINAINIITKHIERATYLKQNRVFLDELTVSNSLEPILMSIINNRIIKEKRPGESYVQAAYTGFEKSRVFESNDLKFYREDNEGGLTPAQLRLPIRKDMLPYVELMGGLDSFNNSIKALHKKLDNIRYGDKSEVLTPEEEQLMKLTTVVGSRIPNQQLGSTGVFEVVEFLPIIAGNVAHVSPEIVALMGSDMDFDKLVVEYPTFKGSESGMSYNDISNVDYVAEYIGYLKNKLNDKKFNKKFMRSVAKNMIAEGVVDSEVIDEFLKNSKELQRNLNRLDSQEARGKVSSSEALSESRKLVDEYIQNLSDFYALPKEVAERIYNSVISSRMGDMSDADNILQDEAELAWGIGLDEILEYLSTNRPQFNQSFVDTVLYSSAVEAGAKSLKDFTSSINNRLERGRYLSTDYMHNRMIELHKELLLHPSRKATLLSPVSDEVLIGTESGVVWQIRMLTDENAGNIRKEFYDKINELEKQYTKANLKYIAQRDVLFQEAVSKYVDKNKKSKNPWIHVADPMVNIRKALSFLVGKSNIGVAARHITSHNLTQQANAFVNLPIIVTELGMLNNNNDILFDVNLVDSDGNYVDLTLSDLMNPNNQVKENNRLVGIKNKKGKVIVRPNDKLYPSLAGSMSVDGNNIVQTISAFLNAYVDVAKDPYIFDINAGNATVDTFLYLIRLGASLSDVTFLMNQPSILDYIKEKSKYGSTFKKAYGISPSKDAIVSSVLSKYDSSKYKELHNTDAWYSFTDEKRAEILQSLGDSSYNDIKYAKIYTNYVDALSNWASRTIPMMYSRKASAFSAAMRSPNSLELIENIYKTPKKRGKNVLWNPNDESWSYMKRQNLPSMTRLQDGITEREADASAQKQFLDMFLEYERQANVLFQIMNGTSHDTYGSSKTITSTNEFIDSTSVAKDGIAIRNSDKMISNTIVKAYAETIETSVDMFSSLMYKHSVPHVADTINTIYKTVADHLSSKRKESFMNYINEDFMTFLIHANLGSDRFIDSKQVYEKLMIPSESSRYRHPDNVDGDPISLLDYVSAVNSTNSNNAIVNELRNNAFFRKLYVIGGEDVTPGIINGENRYESSREESIALAFDIGAYSKPEMDKIIADFRKIKNLDRTLYYDLITLGFAQYGLKSTPFTYVPAIPFEDRVAFVVDKVDEFSNLHPIVQMKILENYQDQAFSSYTMAKFLSPVTSKRMITTDEGDVYIVPYMPVYSRIAPKYITYYGINKAGEKFLQVWNRPFANNIGGTSWGRSTAIIGSNNWVGYKFDITDYDVDQLLKEASYEDQINSVYDTTEILTRSRIKLDKQQEEEIREGRNIIIPLKYANKINFNKGDRRVVSVDNKDYILKNLGEDVVPGTARLKVSKASPQEGYSFLYPGFIPTEQTPEPSVINRMGQLLEGENIEFINIPEGTGLQAIDAYVTETVSELMTPLTRENISDYYRSKSLLQQMYKRNVAALFDVNEGVYISDLKDYLETKYSADLDESLTAEQPTISDDLTQQEESDIINQMKKDSQDCND